MTESDGGRPGRGGREVGAAARFAGVVTVVAVLVMTLVAVWAHNCDRSTVGTAACAPPYRMALSFAGPAILLVGGLRAFVRTYRVWQVGGIWWGWHGAGWFLLTMMMVMLMTSGPPIIGSPLG